MEITRRSRRAHEMDMTPLIDIVFLLVIFFMLTTSFVASESIELNLPSADAATKTPPSELAPIRIRMNERGELLLNDTPMDRASLETQLLETLANTPDTPIGIFTTPGVSVQELVGVMDMVYLAGGRKVKVDRIDFAPAQLQEGNNAV